MQGLLSYKQLCEVSEFFSSETNNNSPNIEILASYILDQSVFV